jgi:hypothetical protein
MNTTVVAVVLPKAHPKSWSNYGPVIVSERAETAFGSHPCRGFSINYDRIGRCHGIFRKFEERTGSQRNTPKNKERFFKAGA